MATERRFIRSRSRFDRRRRSGWGRLNSKRCLIGWAVVRAKGLSGRPPARMDPLVRRRSGEGVLRAPASGFHYGFCLEGRQARAPSRARALHSLRAPLLARPRLLKPRRSATWYGFVQPQGMPPCRSTNTAARRAPTSSPICTLATRRPHRLVPSVALRNSASCSPPLVPASRPRRPRALWASAPLAAPARPGAPVRWDRPR